MATFDTNVVVRLIVEDDPVQGRRAEAAWRTALAGDGVFLPEIVVETFWVLRRAYRLEATEVVAALRRLFDVEGVEVENDAKIRRALDRTEEGAADFRIT